MCIVELTGLRLGISPHFIFRRAIETQHFPNEEATFRDRLESFYAHGEIPAWVEEYCKRTLNAVKEQDASQPHA